jgi:hypothetical protein
MIGARQDQFDRRGGMKAANVDCVGTMVDSTDGPSLSAEVLRCRCICPAFRDNRAKKP